MTDRNDDETAVDLGRRSFFRRFAGEVVTAATSAVGVVQVLQAQSAEAARELLGGDEPEEAAEPVGYRSAFRWDGDVLHVIDQRRLPDTLAETSIRTAAEAAFAIREGAVAGAPAIAQVAAIGLALSAERWRPSRGFARRAQLRGSANALRNTRPSVADLGRALDRMLARFEAVGGPQAEGDAVAAALRDEAEAIVAEATAANGRLATVGLEALPPATDAPLRLLTHGYAGVLAGGQFGTALGIVAAAHHAGLALHVTVAETRPELTGSRLTAWELAQAGVPRTVVTDAAAASQMADGAIDVLLIGAERIGAGGDLAATTGAYALAVVARRHGVPLLVAAPRTTIDTTVADAAAMPREQRRTEAVTTAAGTRVTPTDTPVLDPVVDVVPAELVTALVTDAGVLHPPFGPAIEEVVMGTPLRDAE